MNAISPVDQMTKEAFEKNWNDLGNRPPPFQKLEQFMQNPAPAHIPIHQVLKQIANFLKSSLNLTVFESDWDVKAAGLACFKPET